MEKRVIYRVLGIILCAVIVFQSVSYQAFAQTAYDVEEQQETTMGDASEDGGITEASTEAVTEPSTEALIENLTETSTEAAVENLTETSTEALIENLTEASTETPLELTVDAKTSNDEIANEKDESLDQTDKTATQHIFTEEEKADNKVGTLYAALNTKSTLGDIELPEGWRWVKPATVLGLNGKASNAAQSFKAVYSKEGYESYEEDIEIYVYQLEGVTLTGNDKVVEREESAYEVDYNITGTAEPNAISLLYDVSDGSAVKQSNENTLVIKPQIWGKFTIAVTPIIDGVELDGLTAKKEILVPKGGFVSDIAVSATMEVDKGFLVKDGNIYVDSHNIGKTMNLSAKGYKAGDEDAQDVTFTWGMTKPDFENQNVAEISEDGVVTIKNAGTVDITVTAGDEGAYVEHVSLIVDDFAPALGATKLTAYAASSNGTKLPIYVNALNPVTDVIVAGSEHITASVDQGLGTVDIYVNSNIKTTEKVNITLVTEMGSFNMGEVSVAVNQTLPTVKFRQSGKLNVFYKSGKASFSVLSSEQIKDIRLYDEKQNQYFAPDDVTFDESTLTLNTDRLTNVGKNGIGVVLEVEFENCGTFRYPVKIATESKSPSLLINNASVIAGQTQFSTTIVDKKTKNVVNSDLTAKIEADKVSALTSDIKDGILRLKYTGDKNATYKVTLTSGDWTDGSYVPLTGKISYVKSPRIVLGVKSAILTGNSRTSRIAVSIKDYTGDIGATVAVDKKSENNVVSVRYEDNNIVAELLDIDKQEKTSATYKYTLNPIEGGISFKPVSFTVKVDKKNLATVTYKVKGAVNLVNTNDYVKLTPTLKNTTAKVTAITLSGKAADKFTTASLGNGAFKLSYDDEIAAGLSEGVYPLTATATLDDGNTVSSDIKVTTTVKLPRVKADVARGTLYINSDKAFVSNLVTASRIGSNAIERIEILEDSKDTYKTYKYFKVDCEINKVSPSNARASILIKDSARKNITAGRYTLTCKVYYKSGDKENKKYTTVKYTVTVK